MSQTGNDRVVSNTHPFFDSEGETHSDPILAENGSLFLGSTGLPQINLSQAEAPEHPIDLPSVEIVEDSTLFAIKSQPDAQQQVLAPSTPPNQNLGTPSLVITSSTTEENAAILEAIISGLQEALGTVQSALVTQIYTLDLPLLGTRLEELTSDGLRFLDSLTTNLTLALESLDGSEANFLTQIEQAIASTVGADIVDITGSTDDFTFDLTLTEDQELVSLPIDTSIGLPFFGLEANGTAALTANYGLNFEFDYTTDDGFVLDTAATDELNFGLDATFDFESTGILGFLELEIADSDSNPSNFGLDFGLDIDGADGSVDAEILASSEANLNLDIIASLGTTILPSIRTGLGLGWSFDTAPVSGSEPLGGGRGPSVRFNNVQLDLGSFFNRFLSPVFEQVQVITDNFPFAPFLDVLDTRVPILDDFARGPLDIAGGTLNGPDGQVTILDLAAAQPNSSTEAVETLFAFGELANQIPTGSNPFIDLGSFDLTGADIQSPDFELSEIDLVANLTSLGPVADVISQLELFGADEALGFFDSQEAAMGLSFPLIEDPTSALGLLFGQPLDLFVFDVPELGIDYPIDIFFPLLGPLGVLLEGNLEAVLDFDVGFDTTGFQAFLDGGDPLDILNGFYIDLPPGEDDPSEAGPVGDLDIDFNAFAGLDAVVASAGVGGGIFSDLEIFFQDEGNDGRVYLDEFDADCLFNPVAGQFGAELSAFVEFGFSIFSYVKRFVFAKTTLLSFETGCEGPHDPTLNSGLATDLGNGVLRLNLGPNAGARLIDGEPGTDGSEFFTVQSSEDPADGAIEVNAFGVTETFGAADLIEGSGGNNDDVIVVADDIMVAASLDGGNGNDNLYGGSGDDSLVGGNGDGSDNLFGGAGNDSLEGGDGDDYLLGGADADVIDGGEGFDQTSYLDSEVAVRFAPDPNASDEFIGVGGDAEGDRLISIEYIEGSLFSDRLEGAGENNTFEGFAGNDTLIGRGGQDFLIGGAGADLINGGGGARDATTYIPSPGQVNINLATGFAFGGDANGDTLIGIEDVQGSVFDDSIVGNNSGNQLGGFRGDDTLDGAEGNDRLDGNIGDDLLIGEAGSDTLIGGEGNDTASYQSSLNSVNVNLFTGQGSGGDAEGDAGGDMLFSIENLIGSFQSDTLVGNAADNLLQGLAGADILTGGLGDDTLEGGSGADVFNGGFGLDWVDYRQSFSGVNVNLNSGGANGDAIGDVFIQQGGFSTVENIYGSDQTDTLTGDEGNNVIDPGLGNGVDIVDGDEGSDRLQIDYSRNDAGLGIFGGYGLGSTSNGAIGRNLDATTVLDGVEFSNIEHIDVIGTIQADLISGGAGDDVLLPGAGNDIIFGGQGSNRILAGSGDDLVIDQNDADLLFSGIPDNSAITDLDGGDGLDTLWIDLSGKINALGANPAIVLVSTDPLQENTGSNFISADGTISIRRFEVFQNIRTGAGRDTITQLGLVNNQFETGAGDDIVNPGQGFDTVDGGSAPSPLTDDDLLILDFTEADGSGVQVETALFQSAAAGGRYFRTASDMDDTVIRDVEFRNFERFLIRGSAENDELFGGDRSDTLRGNEGNDILIAGFGDDIAVGGDGADFIIDDSFLDAIGGISGGDDRFIGGLGNDVIAGGTGNDQIRGGAGDDVLLGVRIDGTDTGSGAEIDTLFGGVGADEFILGSETTAYYDDGNILSSGTQNFAQIEDFNPNQGDMIQLHGSANDYVAVNTPSGTEIYLNEPVNELIAVISGFNGFNLNANYIRYANESDPPGDFIPPISAAAAPLTRDRSTVSTVTSERSTENLVAVNPSDLPLGIEQSEAITALLQPFQTASLATPAPIGRSTIESTPGGFVVTQNNDPEAILNALLGDNGNIVPINATLTGDGRAFGIYENDPFNLGPATADGTRTGFVISTGDATRVPGVNISDGGLAVGSTVSLDFVALAGSAGANDSTTVYRADLSNLGFDIQSLNLRDIGNGEGAPGFFSGLDLSAIKLSTEEITNAADVEDLPGLDVFDFSPGGLSFTPGSQTSTFDPNLISPDLFGTLNGLINNQIATLESFDGVGATATTDPDGYVSLGNGGQIGLDLTQAVPDSDSLFLYVGEVGLVGELPVVEVSSQSVAGSSDLSTDLGTPGAVGDTVSLELDFIFGDPSGDGTNTAPIDEFLYFQFVFGSEELVERGGDPLSDSLTLELNGFNFAQLSDGAAARLNTLAPTPLGLYHPDLIYNPVEGGPASAETRLDGFTEVLTFAAPIQNGINTLKIELADVRDGLLDSALFIRGGSLDTDPTLPQVLISPDDIRVTESGRENAFSVVLNTVPTDDVTVTITPDLQLNVDEPGSTPQTLTFTPETAFIPQTVMVSAVDDSFVEGLPPHTGDLSFTISSLDSNYDGFEVPDLTIDILDNDTSRGDILDILGTPSEDTLVGTTDSERIFGFAESDRLSGNDGNDTLFGAAGEDRLLGQTGNDSLLGGNDADTLIGGDGQDTVRGNSGDDEVNGGNNNDLLQGDIGDDEVNGGSGDDTLNGNAGNDVLLAGSGNDLANGGAGNDTLNGSSGNDTLNGSSGNDRILGLGGQDSLLGGDNLDTLLGGFSNDTLRGQDGNDVLNGEGNNDRLFGDAGNDTLLGGAGSDFLTGSIGNDLLRGEAGNDTLIGGAGRDSLIGAQGNDVLSGEGGIDAFIFVGIFNSLGIDRITDFAGNDELRLSRATFGLTGTGTIAPSDFEVVMSNGAAANSTSRITYNANNGRLFFNENGADAGLGNGGQFAFLQNQFGLDSSDIRLIN